MIFSIKLADIPAVPWLTIEATETMNRHFVHGPWIVYPSFDDKGKIGMWGCALSDDEATAHSWTKSDDAKRYAEIQIYLGKLRRALGRELAGHAS